MLWEQKDGQITLESPGPIFDEGAVAAKPSNRPSPGAIAGQVAAIKTLLGLRKVITNADVQEHLKCDPATARAVLKQLVESGARWWRERRRGRSIGPHRLEVVLMPELPPAQTVSDCLAYGLARYMQSHFVAGTATSCTSGCFKRRRGRSPPFSTH